MTSPNLKGNITLRELREQHRQTTALNVRTNTPTVPTIRAEQTLLEHKAEQLGIPTSKLEILLSVFPDARVVPFSTCDYDKYPPIDWGAEPSTPEPENELPSIPTATIHQTAMF